MRRFELGNNIKDQVRDQVYNKVNYTFRHKVRDQVWNKILNQIHWDIRDQIWWGFKTQITDNICYNINNLGEDNEEV